MERATEMVLREVSSETFSLNKMPSRTKLIILDLDETLIHAVPKGTSELSHITQGLPYHEFSEFYIFERPNLEEFLRILVEDYRLAVWTAAQKEYATFVVNNILKPKLEGAARQIEWYLHADHCDISSKLSGVLKDLRVLPVFGLPYASPDDALIVDDNTFIDRQEHRVINIVPFSGRHYDFELINTLTEIQKTF